MAERFVFSDLRELFAKANEEKSGDQLARIAARSERERVAAKRKLAERITCALIGQSHAAGKVLNACAKHVAE